MLLIVIDGLRCFDHPGCTQGRFPGVRIPVESRKVAARNVESYLVSGFEDITGGPKIDRVSINLAWNDRLDSGGRVSIPAAGDTIG